MKQKNRSKTGWIALPRVLPLSLALIGSQAYAAEAIEFENGVKLDYQATVSYGVGVRVKDPSDKLTDGPKVGSTTVGRNPLAINLDDGNHNFGKGDLTSNRLGLNAEMNLSRGDMGLMLRGTAFYDDVYHKSNANNSPKTVNKFGANDQFTDGTQFYSGGRAKFLDAYVYNTWDVGGDKRLTVKLGNQVVAWGESLFYGNASAAQVPFDAVKGLSPGTEVKEMLLPVPQVSGLLELAPNFSLMGYYQFQWKGTELPPVGSYLSNTDLLGPGAEFIRNGFGDPFGGVAVPDPRVQGKLGANYIPFGEKEKPSNDGQFGIGARWGVTDATELSAYYLQYHDKNPNVRINYGKMPGCYSNPDKFGGAKAACSAAPGSPLFNAYNGTWLPNPQSYDEIYFDKIKLVGASISTRLGDMQVGGELTYRDGVPMLVNTPLGVTAARGKATQAQVSFIQVLGDRPWAPATTLMGELVWTHGISVDDVYGAANLAGLKAPNNLPLYGSSDQFVYTTSKNGEVTGERDKNAYGLTLGMDLSYPGIVPGWDLKVPIRGVWIQGMTPISTLADAGGNFQYSVGTEWKYLGNLELGLTYVGFTRPDPVYRKLGDRDYVSAYAKYTF
ncbi:DUF1302 domain-containing protein [Craterilacuibacter sinensis]|uniref:DUF1302 family protein n=1 Tax=Craterilacuibacter sinensis TaxID=2686017 RepID=A0A845BLF2_9NEIS|nr:DUF1302 family protein [Craterilacuibacter sinensis]MXR37497.1 DUF1302 family protein [Craterilacuibacter sinensis]